jgi:hypothetical protein
MNIIIKAIIAFIVVCALSGCAFTREFRFGFIDRFGNDWSFGVKTPDTFELPDRLEGFKK